MRLEEFHAFLMEKLDKLSALRSEKRLDDTPEERKYEIHCAQMHIVSEIIDNTMLNMTIYLTVEKGVYVILNTIYIKSDEWISQACAIKPKEEDTALFEDTINKLETMKLLCEKLFELDMKSAKKYGYVPPTDEGKCEQPNKKMRFDC